MPSELALLDICKKFDGKDVLSHFNYTFSFNNLYKISGPNGSGKTTLLKIICGSYLADSGNIKTKINLKNNVSYIDNNPRSFFHRLSVIDNLEYFLSLESACDSTESIENLLNYFDISHLRKTLFSNLSQGQMQLMSIVRGIATNTKIIILDESFSFLDQNFKSKLQSLILKKIASENKLVIFCSHDDEVFCDSKYIDLNLK